MSVFTLFNCESDLTHKISDVCVVMILRLQNVLLSVGDNLGRGAGLQIQWLTAQQVSASSSLLETLLVKCRTF